MTEKRKTPELIGEKGKPIRAITFTGGGWSTAMQLGVSHALLVSRGRAPDVVLGISAGAVNAVALAEILQAGGEFAGEKRLERQVDKFRDIFEIYRSSPGKMRRALLPDSLQIDTRRPLEALELPIYPTKERRGRDRSLHSRSGLMNVYNELLQLRIPIGIITRFIRRVLGIRQASEIMRKSRRCVALVSESLRLLDLVGGNLHRLAFLLPLVVSAAARKRANPPEGRSAGELISRNPLWMAIAQAARYMLSLLGLVTAWLILTPLACAASIIVLGICGLSIAARGGRRAWKMIGQAEWWTCLHMTIRRGLRFSWSGTKLTFSLLIFYVIWAAFLSCVTLCVVMRTKLFVVLHRYYSQRVKGVSRLEVIADIINKNVSLEAIWIGCAIFLGALILLTAIVGVIVWIGRYRLPINFLRRNAIADGLLDLHPVRKLFIRMFDLDYYGKIDMDEVVDKALKGKKAAKPFDPIPKKIGHYSRTEPRIRVGIAAANVASGDLETIPESENVVDSLLAAIAVVPIFPPQDINGRLYVDGCNIAYETTSPLMRFLRERIPRTKGKESEGQLNCEASSLLMYPVSPLPLGKPQLALDKDDEEKFASDAHVPLIDVALRAMKLKQFQDATLERRLTELHTRAMPKSGDLVFHAGPGFSGDEGADYLRTWVYPIEPDRPISANRRLMRAETEDARRRIMAETVADGCRATLERMLQGTISELVVQSGCEQNAVKSVSCLEVMKKRLEGKSARLPGSGDTNDHGPGLFEVCRHCKISRRESESDTEQNSASESNSDKTPPGLVFRDDEKTPKSWPRDYERETTDTIERLKREEDERKGEARDSLKLKAWDKTWPRNEPAVAGAQQTNEKPNEEKKKVTHCTRPTVSFLFSGGVFRGVYQVGVLNALSMVGLQPDLVAGASVGSITASMAAELFTPWTPHLAKTHTLRIGQLQRLAGTYMAIDRLVLTDRFADFIRTVTVRAAQTKFSLRKIDRFVRQYDQAPSGVFSKEARTVMAGLERLFYLSPFELRALLEAMRRRELHKVLEQMREYFQEWLDRGGVGDEILGAEPLSLLIAEHVLPKVPGAGAFDLDAPGFEQFIRDGVVLVGTATNLTKGHLEILGELLPDGIKDKVSLRQGLLASSAFPGVFRPRWHWEVRPGAGDADLFSDGGVMDNLPFDAVARFLNNAAQADLIATNPVTTRGSIPHLVFSASLRADPVKLEDAEVRDLKNNWIRLRDRARCLGYNQKLKLYEEAQRAIRRIRKSAIGKEEQTDEQSTDEDILKPLDLEILTIRPNWLCGTFSFHPMLGFRRKMQARSIAHGCASTLLELGTRATDDTQAEWLEEWGVELDVLPNLKGRLCKNRFIPIKKNGTGVPGGCWYSPDTPCTFSQMSMMDKNIPDEVSKAVYQIYRECGRPSTHLSGK